MTLPALQPSPEEPEITAPPRPKIMRRPAHFAGGLPSAPLPATAAPKLAAPPADAPMPATRPWQEDGRFGLALILVLLAVNLGLMLWLPPMTALHSTVNAASVPVVIGTAEPLHAPVTLYRQSAEARQPVHILGLPEPTLRQETPASAP